MSDCVLVIDNRKFRTEYVCQEVASIDFFVNCYYKVGNDLYTPARFKRYIQTGVDGHLFFTRLIPLDGLPVKDLTENDEEVIFSEVFNGVDCQISRGGDIFNFQSSNSRNIKVFRLEKGGRNFLIGEIPPFSFFTWRNESSEYPLALRLFDGNTEKVYVAQE
ncbi:hypothetical protein ACT4R9_11420 [Ornithobacterium rhinotracheale]|uniref:hypothetical protein n=1 Tax=Ornithobacterium rhinotracheale TaxID=28251 RepID=UPI003FA44617